MRLGPITQIPDLDAIRPRRKVVEYVAAERVCHRGRDEVAALQDPDLAASQWRSGRTVGDCAADVTDEGQQ